MFIFNNLQSENKQYSQLKIQINFLNIIYLPSKNFILNLPSITLAYGVTGNTSGFGPEESRFEP